ncbi:O-methyltransferase [Veillonella sp. YH-vei2232]|jgi:predicted O-methyltransferase YrrM|uniref:tRNA 5-hydroxyuridine methyltransferase n=1 Tax=Veillonella absiana TaxID=3079305 RepID=A0ABU3Z793_9FIRM|nr:MULTISPECIES: O-methyltransferase [unclassified Veillonella]NCB96092.1 O-methyltransferase [Negativicutes bacterium]MBK7921932.1 O-methyltransferase [Veillonella sp.]MBP6922823.1 O-methyltransferase [Veillonella sp.]MBP8616235.1 O-methyltransferase [Veillonella sp.]MBP9517486.1 O-methyltransferase [Veillonella sp.]
METNEILNEQRIYAMINNVPILRESEVHLFEELLSLYQPTSVLEIGTAIGYSTLLMARQMGEGGHITSIELDTVRHEMAKYYIGQSDYKDNVYLLNGDANEILVNLKGEYDLVFLDGPKGQYLKQLELIMPLLKEGAVVLADNVLFRGYVRGDKEPPRRFKTITKRLQEYLNFVENKELFNTTIYPLGDGMSVSVWKGSPEQ